MSNLNPIPRSMADIVLSSRLMNQGVDAVESP